MDTAEEAISAAGLAFGARLEEILFRFGATATDHAGTSIEELQSCDLPPGVMRRAWVCLRGERMLVTDMMLADGGITVRTYPASRLSHLSAAAPA